MRYYHTLFALLLHLIVCAQEDSLRAEQNPQSTPYKESESKKSLTVLFDMNAALPVLGFGDRRGSVKQVSINEIERSYSNAMLGVAGNFTLSWDVGSKSTESKVQPLIEWTVVHFRHNRYYVNSKDLKPNETYKNPGFFSFGQKLGFGVNCDLKSGLSVAFIGRIIPTYSWFKEYQEIRYQGGMNYADSKGTSLHLQTEIGTRISYDRFYFHGAVSLGAINYNTKVVSGNSYTYQGKEYLSKTTFEGNIRAPYSIFQLGFGVKF